METGRRASGSVLRALMTPAAPEISIIVPVRFARQTINSTLKALLEQCEGIAAEIIAVVSSTDPTREALRELACDPKLRIIECRAGALFRSCAAKACVSREASSSRSQKITALFPQGG